MSLHGPVRVLLVDDHRIVLQGLRLFLGMDSELEIVGEALNGKEALEKVAELAPDVVLMDMLMPQMNGVDATRAIRLNHPDTEVVALTTVLEDRYVVGAIQAGAIGYLLKDTNAGELCRAVKAAANGQVQLSPRAAARLAPLIQASENPEKLTERECEVLQLLAEGKSNKDIASRLGISLTTVKSHVSNILMKLGLTSRTQAVLYAAQTGMIP